MVFSDVLFQLYSVLIILFWPVVLIFVVYAVLKFMKLTKEQNKYLSEISEELKKTKWINILIRNNWLRCYI